MKYEVILYDIEIQICKDNLHDAKHANNKKVVEQLEKRLNELVKEKEELIYSNETKELNEKFLELD